MIHHLGDHFPPPVGSGPNILTFLSGRHQLSAKSSTNTNYQQNPQPTPIITSVLSKYNTNKQSLPENKTHPPLPRKPKPMIENILRETGDQCVGTFAWETQQVDPLHQQSLPESENNPHRHMLHHCTASAILFVGCMLNYQEGRIAELPVDDRSNLWSAALDGFTGVPVTPLVHSSVWGQTF